MKPSQYSIADLYRTFVKPQIELELQNDNSISKELIREVIEDIKPNRILKSSLTEDDKNKLLNFSFELFGLSDNDYVPIRGLGIFDLQSLEQNNLDKHTWAYYHKHRSFIEKHIYEKNPSVVESIDFETDQIIKYVPFPNEKSEINFRGLVIGHIQSGKTANFTHLISKLASVGYKFIVVLSGLTNALRQQTQYRIDRELTGNNTSNSVEPFVKWFSHENGYRQLTNLTDSSTGYDGDFTIPLENFDHLIDTESRVVIAVIKKLARQGDEYREFSSVIGRLILWITESKNYQNVPIAIIDDEADQASVDNTSEDDENPSVINHAIRVLLSKFKKSCYIGYTATPFSNVFINPYNSTSGGIVDLYPKDLIYSLPKPKGYFGSSEFFAGEHVSPYVVIAPENEKALINDSDIDCTETMYTAFESFFFAFVCKRARNDYSRNAMLIHTDHRNDIQDVVLKKLQSSLTLIERKISDELDSVFASYLNYCQISESILFKFKESRIISVIAKSELASNFQKFKSELDIRVVNSRGDQLDYYREPLKTLVCIGGNLMSRGLTIEGLIVTYYLRNSSNYDTLLQMARWFGYRSGYHEFIRIFLTQQIYDQFEYISAVEEDLRSEVSRYIQEDLTPLDFAPKVRAHLRMLPSSRLGSARRLRSFSRMTVQTHYISRIIEDIEFNNSLVSSIIRSEFNKFKISGHQFLANDVEIIHLLEFIKKFRQPRKANIGIDLVGLDNYINGQINNSALSHFDILVSSRKVPYPNAKIEDIMGLQWNPVIRSARGSGGWDNIEDEIVNIGVISSSGDIPDINDSNFTKPLLILYSIDTRNSNSFRKYIIENQLVENEMIDNLSGNVKGFALTFPQSKLDSDRLDYYQQIF